MVGYSLGNDNTTPGLAQIEEASADTLSRSIARNLSRSQMKGRRSKERWSDDRKKARQRRKINN